MNCSLRGISLCLSVVAFLNYGCRSLDVLTGNGAESIALNAVKTTETEVHQCTDTGIAALMNARDSTTLKSTYDSSITRCTEIETPDLQNAIHQRISSAPQNSREGVALYNTWQKVGSDTALASRLQRKMQEGVDSATKEAETRLTAVYKKRLPELVASEEAEARRVASEKLAREQAGQAERRKAVYALVGAKRFEKLDNILSSDVSIASKIAGARIGLKEWTIGMDWTPEMTSRMSSCVSGFKPVVPELFKEDMSDAQVAARDALQPLFDSFKFCVAQATVLEEPVNVILGFKKDKLTHVQYHLDLEHKDLLLNALMGKYGKPDKTDKKVETREEFAKRLRKNGAKMSCALYKVERRVKEKEKYRRLCDPNSLESVGAATLAAGMQIPEDGARLESYYWNASHTSMSYANEWAESNERKSYLRVIQASSLLNIGQLTVESQKLASDIVKAYSRNREATRNRQRSKDF